LRALNTVTITAAPTLTGSGTVTGASGSGSLMACGGPAGILCPAGSYCAVTDRVNDIGVCDNQASYNCGTLYITVRNIGTGSGNVWFSPSNPTMQVGQSLAVSINSSVSYSTFSCSNISKSLSIFLVVLKSLLEEPRLLKNAAVSSIKSTALSGKKRSFM
jgi:hypothetical protein